LLISAARSDTRHQIAITGFLLDGEVAIGSLHRKARFPVLQRKASDAKDLTHVGVDVGLLADPQKR
jgi:hypothetical protein